MTDGKGETNKNGDNVLYVMSLKQEERRIVILASYSFTAVKFKTPVLLLIKYPVPKVLTHKLYAASIKSGSLEKK